MASSRLSGIAVAEVIAGFVLAWSGIKGTTLQQTLTSLLKGQNPAKVTETPPSIGIGESSSTAAPGTPGSSTGATAPAAPANVSGNEATGKLMAAARGWTGSQWDALYSLWERESGWSNTVRNSSSGALGIAQALGHGTATSGGSLGNEYPSTAANNGSAAAQISWGLSYIAQRYGTPEGAWAHEEQFGWY